MESPRPQAQAECPPPPADFKGDFLFQEPQGYHGHLLPFVVGAQLVRSIWEVSIQSLLDLLSLPPMDPTLYSLMGCCLFYPRYTFSEIPNQLPISYPLSALF